MNSNRVFAIIENDNGGVYRSDDGGATWKLLYSSTAGEGRIVVANNANAYYHMYALVTENIGNTSQHLQRMLRAGLVRCEKQGIRRIYSLANTKILDIWFGLQELAIEIAPAIQVDENYLSPAELCSDLELSEILKLVKLGKAVLVDSRTEEEFESSPAKGALNFPVSQLSKLTASLSKSRTVFIFCRGRYCVLANQVVMSLRKRGFKAYRLKETSYQINEAM